MAFRIVLTVFFACGPMIVAARIGQPREPLTNLDAWLQIIFGSVLIFGIWRWL